MTRQSGFALIKIVFIDCFQPLALVTWGHRMEMSKVAPERVVEFIKERALKGPEMTHRNGQYEYFLKEKAQVVSDMADTIICPNGMNFGFEMRD